MDRFTSLVASGEFSKPWMTAFGAIEPSRAGFGMRTEVL
jgi:hypothetical protein